MSAEKPDSGVRFELLDAGGTWQPIDFSKSVFAGGVAPCGDRHGICAQLVMPGQYIPGSGRTALRAIHPDYGVLPGSASTFETDAKTLQVEAAFDRGNLTLNVLIHDVIGGDPTYRFPRPYEGAVWERRGVCVPGFRPADTQFGPVQTSAPHWQSPDPLSAEGRYCAGVRGIETSGDPGIDEPVAVDTLPETVTGDHVYTVPTEETPFSYQIVLDLSIPVADRCPQAMQLIEKTVADTIGKHSKMRTLPTIDLAAAPDPDTGQPGMPCRQAPARSLDAAAVAQQVKLAAATWTEQHPRYFLLYFNNLRATLPDPLTASLRDFEQTIVTPPPPVDFVAAVWGFGPPEMTGSFEAWSNTMPWMSAEEMSFAQQLDLYAGGALPLISEIQDPSKPVPILPDGDAARYDGTLIRLCQVSVTPIDQAGLRPIRHDDQGMVVPLPSPVLQWPVSATDPPAYLLDLPPVWAVAKTGFTPHQAHIRYEICTRYCTHSFISEMGIPAPDGWKDNPDRLCMGPPPGAGSGT